MDISEGDLSSKSSILQTSDKCLGREGEKPRFPVENFELFINIVVAIWHGNGRRCLTINIDENRFEEQAGG